MAFQDMVLWLLVMLLMFNIQPSESRRSDNNELTLALFVVFPIEHESSLRQAGPLRYNIASWRTFTLQQW